MSGLYSVFAVLAAMFALAGLEVFNHGFRQGTQRARAKTETVGELYNRVEDAGGELHAYGYRCSTKAEITPHGRSEVG